MLIGILSIPLVLQCPAPARAVVSVTAGPDGNGVIINTLLGADRFYNAGYFGQNSVVSNVEAGAIWNGHETLTQVNTYIFDPTITGTQLGQFDYHATAVGMTIAGQGQYYYYQVGMAPLTQLWSAPIATQFHDDGSFEITPQSFLYGYRQSMQVGRDVTYDLGFGLSYTEHRVADVINSSWGFEDPAGSAFETLSIDALAAANHTTVVVSAGNSGPGSNTVGGPASGYNNIAVGALAQDTSVNPYTVPVSFSSRGPNDFYNPKTGVTILGVCPGVDIAAPGESLALAAYGGTTGTNSNSTLPVFSDNNLYYTELSGTSFSAPLVSGGAALIADYSHANFGPHGWDGRVVKAILLNSADKTFGWDNGQHIDPDGVIRTTQGLDFATGAGRMNLNRAFDQLTAGTTDNPTFTADGHAHVQHLGWLMGQAGSGPAPTDYYIDQPLIAGQHLTATLTWFVDRTLTDPANIDDTVASDNRFDNLDLQIWQVIAGQPTTEMADSFNPYNNVQHLAFDLPTDGLFMLRILWMGQQYDFTTPLGQTPTLDDFALAWSDAPAPEPTFAVLLIIPVLILRRRTSPV